MKKFFRRTSLLLAAAFLGAATMQAQKSPQDMDRFIDALIKRMTVEEKIGQLNLPVTGEITTGQAKNSDVAKKIERGLVGGLFNLKGVAKIRDVQKLAVENSRLGIPLLFGMDVIHGYETIFPIPLGLSCTWDMAAIQESARIAAVEASADGISWTFSPMVDISRDPRWGRVSEGSGEDPFLGGAIAKAMVYGYQGANLDDQLKRNDEILACVKHFALYGAGEAGRDYNTVDMSRNRMFNEYMYPYEAAVEAAGVGDALGGELGDDALLDVDHGLELLVGDHGHRAVDAHAARVGAEVAVEGALVVLRGGQGHKGLAVGEGQKRALGALHHLLHDDGRTGVAEDTAEALVDALEGLLGGLCHDDALAGGKAVGLDHDGAANLLDIGRAGGLVGKAAVGGGGHAGARHEIGRAHV